MCEKDKKEDVAAEELKPQEIHDVKSSPDDSVKDEDTSVSATPKEEDLTDSSEPKMSPNEPPSLTEINETLSELRSLFESKIARDRSQSAMFDKFYQEMKGYKENFLLESLQKPLIKNLIMLYDDFTTLESQLDGLINENKHLHIESLKQFQSNLENFRHQILEVLYRMDAVSYEEKHEEKLERLDRKLHKTLQVVPTDNPEDDGKIEHIYKTGFYWRDKVIRPEEVSIFKYQKDNKEEE